MDKDEMSLLGRMMKFHILSATPILYAKPQARWPLILSIIIIIVLVLGRVAP